MKTNCASEKKIDWDLIKQRLAAAAQALDDEFAPPPARRRAVLTERARALAAMPLPAPQTGLVLDAFEFELDGDCYAIGMQYAQEVHPLRELTPLPCTPPFVRGIVNLHGCITAVVDLKILLSLRGSHQGAPNSLILLRNGEMRFCILADRILGAGTIPLDAIQRSTEDGVNPDLLLGMTAQRLTVLDGEKLLSDKILAIA